MPELPEVERGRKIAERVGLGRSIVRVDADHDEIVLARTSPSALRRSLVGGRIESVRRKGKYIWFELDRRPWPLFHFGMAGAFRVPDESALPLASDWRPREEGWPPRFTKILMEFEDGGQLAMTDKRRLGRIRLFDDVHTCRQLTQLGFDPLLEFPRLEQFAGQLAKRRGAIKGLLLDQSFAAGVGNWIADEVLYQAGIAPTRPVDSLDPAEVKMLARTVKSVIQKAVAVDAESARFPRHWLFHHRWGKRPNARTARGEPIEHIVVVGRTTAWVPTAQR